MVLSREIRIHEELIDNLGVKNNILDMLKKEWSKFKNLID
jgi:hypothetical protein